MAKDTLLKIDDHYRAMMERAGLTAFEDIMSTSRGRCLRKLPGRENWYLPVEDIPESRLAMYLKKHHVRTWSTRVSATLGVKPPASAGRVEARNAESLAALGIDVMRPVAYGEKLCADGRLDSFLITEELEGYEELQDFVRRRFPPSSRRRSLGTEMPGPCQPGAAGLELRRLIRQVAEIARRFHGAGYNHRDFYCCHFLVKETAPGAFDVRLIDLQRVQHRRWFRWRWIVKDLAQLASMAPDGWIGCRDKVTFLRRYLGVKKLGPRDKRLVRAVLSKESRIRRRQIKNGDKSPHSKEGAE